MKLSIKEIEPIKDRFIQIATPEVWQKESSFALQLFKRNPKLLECQPESVLESVLNVANIGLTLNPAAKLAYLIPRFAYGQMYCVLEPSYQGMVKLITDTGSVSNVYAHPVYEGDQFEVILGTASEVIHKPAFKSKNITHFYAVAYLTDNNKMIEVMPKDEVDEIMYLSESYKAFKAGKVKSCVWVEHYSEMGRKTVIRRITKYLPKSDKWDKLNKAIEIQEQDFRPSDGALDYAESLLHNSTYSPEKIAYYEGKLPYLSSSEFSTLVADLKENQVDPISAGKNYQATDVVKKLKNEIG